MEIPGLRLTEIGHYRTDLLQNEPDDTILLDENTEELVYLMLSHQFKL